MNYLRHVSRILTTFLICNAAQSSTQLQWGSADEAWTHKILQHMKLRGFTTDKSNESLKVVHDNTGSPLATFNRTYDSGSHSPFQREEGKKVTLLSLIARDLGFNCVPVCRAVQGVHIPEKWEGMSGILEKYVSVFGDYRENTASPALLMALKDLMKGADRLVLSNLKPVRGEKDKNLTHVETVVSSISRRSAEQVYLLFVIASLGGTTPYRTNLTLNKDGLLEMKICDVDQLCVPLDEGCPTLLLPHGDYPFSAESIEFLSQLTPESPKLRFLTKIKLAGEPDYPGLERHQERIPQMLERIRHLRSFVLRYPTMCIRQIHERAFVLTGLSQNDRFLSDGEQMIRKLVNIGRDLFLKNEEIPLLDQAYKGVNPIHVSYADNSRTSLLEALTYLHYLAHSYGWILVTAPVLTALSEDPEIAFRISAEPKETIRFITGELDFKLSEVKMHYMPNEWKYRKQAAKK